jgi:endonuclease III-like uncharacterized protein
MLRPRTLQEISALRSELLAVTGIGPETADSVLLYAGNYPVFVVDAYTQRIFARHKIVTKKPISNKKLCHPERGRKRGPRQAPLLRLVGFGMRESRDNAAAFASRPDFVSEKRRANQYEFIRVAVEHALARPMIPAVQKSLGHPPSPMSLAPRSAAAQQLNEFHALIVQVGKNHCFKSQPDCIHCPLRRFLES